MGDGIKGRCGNCMEPFSRHRPRREAAPICVNGRGIYREATEDELSAGYAAAFPDGLKPLATFHRDNPSDMERLSHAFQARTADELIARLTPERAEGGA